MKFVDKLKLSLGFLIDIFKEGSVDMLAMFLANRIILGKLTFAKVPAVLKPAVREILEEAGLGELCTEE